MCALAPVKVSLPGAMADHTRRWLSSLAQEVLDRLNEAKAQLPGVCVCLYIKFWVMMITRICSSSSEAVKWGSLLEGMHTPIWTGTKKSPGHPPQWPGDTWTWPQTCSILCWSGGPWCPHLVFLFSDRATGNLWGGGATPLSPSFGLERQF